MWNAGLGESQAGIKIAGRNINNLRYADTTLMVESKEELKSLLMKVKAESEKAGLKLSIQKSKIMESGPITSWQIDGETGSCSDGWGHASKSLIHFSVDGRSCVLPLLFTWGQTMVKVMKIMVTSFKRSHACTATHPTLQCPLACSRSPPTHASAGSWCSQGLFEPSEHLWQERVCF